MSILKDTDDEPPNSARKGLATQFGEALQAGQHPDLEEYLKNAPTDERDKYLAELICEEYAYRWIAGEMPTLAEYHARFPSDGGFVQNAIRKS